MCPFFQYSIRFIYSIFIACVQTPDPYYVKRQTHIITSGLRGAYTDAVHTLPVKLSPPHTKSHTNTHLTGETTGLGYRGSSCSVRSDYR